MHATACGALHAFFMIFLSHDIVFPECVHVPGMSATLVKRVSSNVNETSS